MADAATTADAVGTDAARTIPSSGAVSTRSRACCPLGAFLCFHVFENLRRCAARPLRRDGQPREHDAPAVVLLRAGAGDHRPPAAYHSLYGGLGGGDRTPQRRPLRLRRSNWGYLTQRITGVVAFLFLLVHVGTLRTWVTLLGHPPGAVPPVTADGRRPRSRTGTSPPTSANPASLGVQSILAGDHIFALYVIGTLCTIWHFTYGLKGLCWTWGIAVGDAGPDAA